MIKNQEKVWDKKLEDYKSFKFDDETYAQNIFYKWLKKDLKRGKALDQGCGTGFYTIMLERMGYDVTGLDISMALLSEAKKNKEKFQCSFKLIRGDIRKMPFKDETFDVLLSGGIIEHVKETEKTLNEIQRVIKKGGILVINVPHKITIFTLVKLLQQFLGIWKIGYEKSFTISRFRRLILKRGFEIKRFYLKDIELGKRQIVGKILRILDYPSRILGLGGQHMFFLCKKK